MTKTTCSHRWAGREGGRPNATVQEDGANGAQARLMFYAHSPNVSSKLFIRAIAPISLVLILMRRL